MDKSKVEDKKLIKKNISLRFDNAQLKQAAKLKVELVVEAQISLKEVNEKLDEANEIGERVSQYKLDH